jgi:hypothetical protein
MSIVYRTPAENMSGWTDIVKQYAADAGKAVAGKALKQVSTKLGITKKPAAAAAVTADNAGAGGGGGGLKKSGPPIGLIVGGIAVLGGIAYMMTRKSAA